jgi:hypothetical protein
VLRRVGFISSAVEIIVLVMTEGWLSIGWLVVLGL